LVLKSLAALFPVPSESKTMFLDKPALSSAHRQGLGS
jgi:hypothetical protein